MESFFSHFKDEVNVQEVANLEELKAMIDDYVFHYNTSRKQLKCQTSFNFSKNRGETPIPGDY
ncbi:IS3 family transposase [Planococcus lenghuensis]|uniref:Integrase catalytic domain-containing protein n=1 Tax=Planococcus lenghuensis TaxID=2213202 RepID=A0A1Q2L4U7_9BACL|nr:IS3 family transposase [Planococcus lenghuensis]AQQ55431.1 hypothetical protein B0X71_19905 [Planococcus lenghuensis]